MSFSLLGSILIYYTHGMFKLSASSKTILNPNDVSLVRKLLVNVYNGVAISKSRNTHFGLFRRQSPLEEIGRGLKQPAFQSKLTVIQQNVLSKSQLV